MAQWIGDGGGLSVGDVGFLVGSVERGREEEGETYSVRGSPARTKWSGEPVLVGQLGATKDVNRFARGVVRVLQVAPNGPALVEPLEGDELSAALVELGWPSLDPSTAPPCEHRTRDGSACELKKGHEDLHLFKCSGPYCEGLPWPSSIGPHPPECWLDPEG